MVLEHRNLSEIQEVAIVAARLAGQRAIEEMKYTKSSLKNDNELVSQADLICQQIIVDRIKETYPDHGFIGEEGIEGEIFKQRPRSAEAIWWVIDPIDGTNNYIHGILDFSVSIAVMYDGEPIVGVVFDPATDSMFTAVKEGEAQLNRSRIEAGEEELNEFSSVGLDSHFENDVPAGICEIMKRTRFRNLGSTALQFAYVASGALAGSLAFCPKLWDIAAGAFIAEEAGAIVSDWDGKKLFPVDLENYTNQPFKTLIANKKVHAELLELANR